MRAKKLPSGSWRCQVMKDGQKKSFTVKDPTKNGKRQCELMAAQWAKTKKSASNGSITIGEAVGRFIDTRRNILSASTIRTYDGIAKNLIEPIADMPVYNISNERLQRWMSEIALTHSAKSCANVRSLLTASIRMFINDFNLKLDIPQRKAFEYRTPTDAEVQRLIERARGTEMEKAIYLAAMGTLRRGEICALTKQDISGNTVKINKSLCQVKGGEYILKGTKNAQSTRTVQLPKKVIDILLASETDNVVSMTPSAVSNRFEHLQKECGIENRFRFHDLRAYAASSRHCAGIPDVYIMADGGWKTDTILKRVYRRTMDDKRKEFSSVANRYYEALI